MYTSAKPYFYGTGRRKKSVARVRIVPGTGVITINKRDIDDYFGLETLKLIVNQPFGVTGTEGKFDIIATVNGGGISAFVTINPTAESVEWRDALYYEAVKDTGLKGNRADPLVERDLKELRGLNCAATLIECGFMDSTVDCPIILTEEYADKIAKAFVAVIVEKSGAKLKSPVELQKTPTTVEKFVSIILPILKRGSRGKAVRSLQTLLNAKGAAISVDGSFGPATDKALREFQESRDLDIDGSCGAETWTTLLTKE